MLETFLRIPVGIIIAISLVTLAYALLALFLAQQKPARLKPVKILIAANWLWSLVSVFLLFFFFAGSSIFGKLFLVLQIIVVAGLAYFEGRGVEQAEKQYP